MAQVRITLTDAQRAIPAPCSVPFVGNKYRDPATGDLVLPDGWTPEVLAYYKAERSDSLVYMSRARLPGGARLAPGLRALLDGV